MPIGGSKKLFKAQEDATTNACSFQEALVYWNSELKNCVSRLEDSGKNVTGRAVKLQIKNGSIVLQFSHPTEMSGNRRKQVNKSLGKSGNKGQLKQAYSVGEDTIEELVKGDFTNDWFDDIVERYTGKKTTKISNLTKFPIDKETEDKLTFNDPNNTQFLLAISHGKTGKRIAMPHNKEWLIRFNLLGVNWDELLPEGKKKYTIGGGYGVTVAHTQWLRKNKCPFTSHKLRHFTNIQLHEKGLNNKAIADSLGHLIGTNQSTYLQYQSANHKAQTIINAVNNHENEQNENERLKEIIKQLTLENDSLKAENEHLKIQVKRLELENGYKI